jgi:hypothetical protein
MTNDHPFQSLFESFGRLPAAHAAAVNRLAYQALGEALNVPLEHRGRCLLLRAPRAGCGKTHLLSHIQQQLRASHELLPLQVAAGARITAATVTDAMLRQLTRLVPAAGAVCALDLIVRRLFSLALQPLVSSGEVPCLDRDGTLASLCERPLETFDFHHPDALSAHWTRDNFGVLGPRLSLTLAQLTDCAPHAVNFWVDALFRFAVAPVDQPARIEQLFQTAMTECCGAGAAMERMAALLALVGLLRRVVLVADDVDGLAADVPAALHLASFLSSLRHSSERLDVILSLNRDVWESAFAPLRSSALSARLTELVIELEPLSDEERVALLEARTPGMGARMLQAIGPDPIDCHARGLLRAAGVAWLKVARESPAAAPTDPSAAPPPLVMAAPTPAHDQTAPPTPAPAAATLTPTAATEPPPLPTPEPPPLPTSLPAAAALPALPDPAPDPAEEVDAERVNALLRQFRERYGRPDPE